MNNDKDDLILINPDNPPEPLSQAARDEIARLAQRQRKANTLLMSAINALGSQVEDGMRLLPDGMRRQINDAAQSALEKSYFAAAKSREGALGQTANTDAMHKLIGAVSGAFGGVGGLPTALAELPVATTLIFRAVQKVAEEYGEDPYSQETRKQCLAVFGSGGPGEADDGVDTSFFGARLSLSGAAVQTIISRIAPKFATVFSQKLATQAVPVLGAVAGAGTNYAYVNYYIEMAHVHFGLRKLTGRYGSDAVEQEFLRLSVLKNPPAKGSS
jgi:hypothetical protein